METIKQVKIERIMPNPIRDFDIYPIHADKLEMLEASYRDGDFGTIIPVRPHPTKAGFYQQACGHHRVAAMQAEGKPLEILCKIMDLGDAEMASIMVRENMNNYGNNPEAVADSVAAVCKVLIYGLFLSNDKESFSQIWEKHRKILQGEGAYEKAKGRLKAHNQIGEKTVHAFFGADDADCPMTKAQIENGLASLNATGKMREICDTQRQRAENKLKAKSRAEAARVAAAEKAAAEAAKARAEFEAAEIERKAKRKKEMEAAKAMKDALARKQAEAKLAADKVNADREHKRQRALKEERERLEAEAKTLRDRKAATEAAQAAAQKAARNSEAKPVDPFLHPQVLSLFENIEQSSDFRKMLNAENGRFRQYFPVNEQPVLVKEMIDNLMINDNFTGRGVREYIIEKDAVYKAEIERQREQREIELRRINEAGDARRKADRMMDDLTSTLSKLGKVYKEIEDASKNEPLVWAQIQGHAGTNNMRPTIRGLEHRIAFLKKNFLHEDVIESKNHLIEVNG